MRGRRSLLAGERRLTLPQKAKNNPMHSRNAVAGRHNSESVKLLQRRANQRQGGKEPGNCGRGWSSQKRRWTTPIGQRAKIAQELQLKASPRFVFCEFNLTCRAKQWHYAMVRISQAAPASRPDAGRLGLGIRRTSDPHFMLNQILRDCEAGNLVDGRAPSLQLSCLT